MKLYRLFPSVLPLLAPVLADRAGEIGSSDYRKLTAKAGRGGVKKCKYAGRFGQGERLGPGEWLERGEGICDGPWTFGLTKGKGKLQLLRDGQVMWTAGVRGIDYCRMQKGGAFACYNNYSCLTKKSKRCGLVWALNCGGARGSQDVYINLDGDDGDVLNMLNSKRGWWVESENGEVDGENYEECATGSCECTPKVS